MNIYKIRPTYTSIITTAEKYKTAGKTGNFIDAKKLEGSYKEYQKVVRVGSSVREVKEGEVVQIDPSRYIKRKFSDNSLREDFVENPIVEIAIPIITMNGKDYFMIEERDVAYVIEEYDEAPEKDYRLIVPKKEIKIIGS